MEIRIAGETVFDSIVDGTGLRAVIFTQGCKHHCFECHNRQTWDFNGGVIRETDKIVREILANPLDKGVTFSGGDPFEQSLKCLDIVLKLKSKGYSDFWAYTGYQWEALLEDSDRSQFLKELNVLVDGRFILEQKSLTLNFRGSSNQRIIDVQKSLSQKSVVLLPL